MNGIGLENDETAKLIAKGHSGALVDEIRKGGVQDDYRTIGRELYAGSVQTRIEELKADAKTAAARLKASPDDPETAAKAKDILSEYLMLDFMTRDKATNQIDQTKLLSENVPYGKIEEMKRCGPGNNPMFKKMIGSISGQQAAELMEDMAEQGDLVRDPIAGQDACYLPDMYRAEKETAERIAAMVQKLPEVTLNLDQLIEECEAEQGMHFAEQQKQILRYAMQNRILAVTGGPGTGKTTSLRAVLKLYDRLGLKTLLAAPTGRAAKRMTELTGVEAATIHRMLGAKLSEDSLDLVFTKNAEDPLRCDALIIDECSMVDIRLMHALLEALPASARLMLVGDAAQLPAVGPGDVFSAILRSEAVPSVMLTEIFRQRESSRIVRNAHLINRGEHPNLSENTGDFFRLQRMQAGSIAETVVELCSVRLPKKMQIPPEEIQVLAPTRKGDCGTAALNRLLQAALNPPAPEKKERPVGEVIFRVGDRLIQNRNDYNVLWECADGSSGLGVFNGDIGILKEINTEEQTMTVDFDGREAKYDFESLGDLEHAWALTVHKSQGSEYRAVILALTDSSRRLLTRTVLYTAVTRARELLIMVGNENIAFRMIDNVAPSRRYNALRIRIREACGK